MKKFQKTACVIIVIIIVISVFIVFRGARIEREHKNIYKQQTSMFVVLESTKGWNIVYHKETHVMYAVSCGLYNNGTFTLLVNADGSPMVYKE